MDLSMRLGLLKDGGQISDKSYQAMLQVIERFADTWGITLEEENGAMLITHLAIAWERMLSGGVVEPLDDMVYQEVKNSQHFVLSQKIIADWEENLKMGFAAAEQGYISLHLCTLLEKEGFTYDESGHWRSGR